MVGSARQVFERGFGQLQTVLNCRGSNFAAAADWLEWQHMAMQGSARHAANWLYWLCNVALSIACVYGAREACQQKISSV